MTLLLNLIKVIRSSTMFSKCFSQNMLYCTENESVISQDSFLTGALFFKSFLITF